MSYLGTEVQRILEKNGLRQIDITKRTQATVASVSRVVNGQTEGVSYDILDKIIDGATKTKQDKIDIIIARFRDSYQGKYKDLVEPMLISEASPSQPLFGDYRLEPHARSAVEYLLKKMPSNPEIGHLLVNLQKAIEAATR